MQTNKSYSVNQSGFEDSIDYVKELYKYLYFWKYFLFSVILLLIIAFTYLRYTPKVYKVTAKVKIIDKRESALELPSASELFSNSKINLENEIEIIKSYPILSSVVKNKNLHTSIVSIGDIIKTLTTDYPFEVELKVPDDSLS